MVEADVSELESTLLNLAINAATHAGRRKLTIETSNAYLERGVLPPITTASAPASLC